MDIQKQFKNLYNELQNSKSQHSIPPKMKDKLFFLAKNILKQDQTQNYYSVQEAELSNLEELNQQTKIKLFISISKCLLGKQQLDYVSNKQIYIKKCNQLLSTWKPSYITYNLDNLILIRNKKKQEWPLQQIILSKGVERKNNKFSFKIKKKKLEYEIRAQNQKVCGQLHRKIKQLIEEKLQQKQSIKNIEFKSLPSQFTCKQNQEVFHTLYQQEQQVNPIVEQFEIKQLQNESSYKIQQNSENYRILVHKQNKNLYKICVTISCLEIQDIIQYYIKGGQWNTQLLQTKVINKIQQNMYIYYEKIKGQSYSSWTRDFIVMKYAFKDKSNYYLLEKSVQHRQYPQFNTYVRGNIKKKVTGFFKNNSFDGYILMITRLQIDFKGYHTQQSNRSMTLKYLKPYSKFPNYCLQRSLATLNKRVFNFNQNSNQNTFQKNGFNKKQQVESDFIQQMNFRREIEQSNNKILQNNNFEDSRNSEIFQPFKSIQNQNQFQSSFEVLNLQTQFIDLLPLYADDKINQKLIDAIQRKQHHSHHIKHRYSFVQSSDKGNLYSVIPPNDFVFQNGDWVRSQANQMIFVNRKAIQAQKDAIKWIFKQIGTNLLKGKSILSMSLPVDIFDYRSYLERSMTSFGYLPIYISKAASIKDELEQIKLVTTFLLSIILLELRIQKPFNPILGQTFQGYIGGIPIYAEQISHHPPITAFYAKTSQFQFHGTIDAHADLGLNSAYAVNTGSMHIKFFNTGLTFQCFLPACQISGLLYGDRKFKLVQKAFVLCQQKSLITQISFGKDKIQLYPANIQFTTSHIFGGIYKVTQQFLQNFLKLKKKQKSNGLSKKDILKSISKLSGAWNQSIFFDDQVYHELYNPIPYKLVYEMYPLASNSNYREDIFYRRLGNLALSQTQKQRLQNIQRHDRKLRQKRKK